MFEIGTEYDVHFKRHEDLPTRCAELLAFDDVWLKLYMMGSVIWIPIATIDFVEESE